MEALQVIFVALVCLALFALIVYNGTKIFYAIKTKGESLKPKDESATKYDKGGKEE